jgi:hypothetical protein
MKIKSFAKTVSDMHKDLEKTFERDITKGVNDPDQTATEENQAGEKTAQSAAAELRTQVDNKIAELMERAELARKELREREAVKNGKPWPLWKKFILVAAIITGLTGVLAVLPDTEREQAEKRLKVERAWEAQVQAQAEYNSSIIVNMQRFNSIMEELRSAPTPTLPPEVPAAVAKIADVPVEVTLTENVSNVEPEHLTTTIGQFYQSVPQARHQIEQDAPRIEHDYDKEDPNSCFRRHCLDEHHKEYEINGFDGKAMKFKY